MPHNSEFPPPPLHFKGKRTKIYPRWHRTHRSDCASEFLWKELVPVKKIHEINMTKGNLLPELLQFILPLMASSLLQLAFNAADLIVVGRFGRPNALAAVGSNGSMINLIVNVLMGLATGGGVLCARHFGAGDKEKLRRTVSTALMVGFVGGIFTGALGVALAEPMLRLIDSPPEVRPLAAVYLRIYFMGMPVIALYNFSSAGLRAMGDTERPLFFLAIAGVLNVLLNLFFVLVLHIDVAGVALATVLSQCVSCFLTVRCLLRTEALGVRDLRFSGTILRQMLRIGLPAGIQGSMFSISNFLIQSSINSFGAAVVAGNAACVSLEGFIYTPQDATAQAATTAISQNVGAQEFDRAKKAVRYCLALVVGLASVLIALAFLFRRSLLGLYTTDEAALSAAYIRLTIVMGCNIFNGTMAVMTGVNRGLGYGMLPAAVTFLGACVFRIVWVYTVFASHRTLGWLYISYPISWIVTTAALFVCYYAVRNRAFKHALAEKA